jgi:hypothetical protein
LAPGVLYELISIREMTGARPVEFKAGRGNGQLLG